MSSLVSAGQSTWQQLYDAKPADQKYLVQLGQQMEGLIITEQEVINANQAMRKSALEHNAALKAQTLSARAGKMAFQALAAAGNMLLFTAVMEGVQYVVNAVDSWIHADEIALEKAESAQSRIDDLNSSYKSHRDAAEELGASYDRLSKGVDTTNNKNLSLSDKDYKSYLDITNQLAETFPTLRNGIDDNGNALLTLGRNGHTAAEDLEELLKAEEELNGYKISQDLDTLLKGVSVKVKEAETDGTHYEDTLHSLESIMNLMEGNIATPDGEKEPLDIFRISGDLANEADSKYYEAIYDALEQFNNSLDTDRQMQLNGLLDPSSLMGVGSDGKFDFQLNTTPLHAKEKKQLFNIIKKQSEGAIKFIEEKIDDETKEQKMADLEAELAWKDFLPSLETATKSESAFKSLGENESGEDIQNFVLGMVSNLDKSVTQKMENSGGAYEWVRKSILLPLMDLDDSDRQVIANAYKSLLTLNPDDLSNQNQSKIDRLTGKIARKLGQKREDVRLNLGFQIDEDWELKYNEAIKNAAEKFGSTESEMKDLFADLGIDTSQKVDIWNKHTDNATNIGDATELYKNAEKPTFPSFTEVWASLDTTEDASLKTTKDDLLALAQAGQLTMETFRDTKGSDTFLANLGIEPDSTRKVQEVIGQVNELVSSTDQLAAMEKGMSGLTGNLYAKQQDPGSAIGAETFAGMDSGLKAQTAEWDNYVNVLGNASSSLSEVQAATDKLATAYIGSNNFLANLTETNKGYYISQLDAMGIDNAEELVQQKLTAKYQIEDLSLKALALTKDGINEDSINSVINLMDEANAVDEVKYAIMDCIIQEQIFSANSDLGVNDKRDQLKELIEYYYGAADAAAFANAVNVGNDGTGKGGAQNHYETLTPQQELKNLEEAHKNEDKTPIHLRTLPRASNGGSTPQKTQTPETFNFIETAITRVKSRIDEAKNAAKEAFQSFKDRGKSYANAIAEIGKQINTQNKAEEKYLEKANSVGLDGKYVSQIQNGSLDIETITDEDLKKRIREYKEWYEKALACREAVRDLKKEQEALARERIELTITKYDKLSAKAQANKDRSQANIEYKEARGLMASAKDYAKINAANGKQISYYRSMNAELSKLQKTVPKGSQAWREYQEKIDANNKSIVELKKNIFETAAATAALAGKKAEKRVAKKDSRIEFLDAELGNETDTTAKNTLIQGKMNSTRAKKGFYKKAVSDDKKNIRKSSQKLKNFKQTSKNKTLLKKIKACVKSKKKISASLLNAAAKLNDKGKLLAACTTYNAHRDALERDRETANLFAETSRTEIANLALEKFSTISEKWDNTLYKNTQKETELNSQLDINESSGRKKDNLNIYQSLLANEENKQQNLIKKRQKLQKRLNAAVAAGNIKEDSSQWLQMTQEIDGVTNAINEAAQSIINYNKAYHSLQWNLFDDAMETMERLNTEADYYIEMMANEKLTDKDAGSLTEYGKATLMLQQKNFQAYQKQAEEYKKEYAKLMGQIQKGELNGADTDVIARKRELEDKIQEKNLAANQTLQKQKELIKDLYDTQLEKVSSLISKYKELMNTEKDAYEYQRTIEQKVKDLATLQKRMDAYSTNDDTEENRARIQKIKMELAEAKQDLKDAQYDKYLSDTENMLDEMYDDMEAFFDEKLDNTDIILESIAELLGSDNESIITTLKSIDDGLSSTLEELIKGVQTNFPNASATTTAAAPAPPAQNANGKKPETPMANKNSAKNKNSSKGKKTSNNKTSGKDKKTSSDKKSAIIKSAIKKAQTAEQVLTSKPERYTKEVVYNTAPAKDTPKKPTAAALESLPSHRNAAQRQIKENLLNKAVIDTNNPLLNFEPLTLFQEASLAPVQDSLPKTLPTLTGNMGNQNVSIDLGGITMYGVNDPKTFGKQLREEICQNGQTTKCITEAVISNAMGNGIGNARFYQR